MVDLALPSGNKWAGSGEKKLTKYCLSNRPEYWAGDGEPDNIQELYDVDDAVIACWGGSWTMPSTEDCEELALHCQWIWIDDYKDTGVHGFLVEGTNKSSIFLPAGGYVNDFGCPTQMNLRGYYWTTKLAANPTTAVVLDFYDGIIGGVGNTDQTQSRIMGALIRPVCKAQE